MFSSIELQELLTLTMFCPFVLILLYTQCICRYKHYYNSVNYLCVYQYTFFNFIFPLYTAAY